jgi:hypothetical protein
MTWSSPLQVGVHMVHNTHGGSVQRMPAFLHTLYHNLGYGQLQGVVQPILPVIVGCCE